MLEQNVGLGVQVKISRPTHSPLSGVGGIQKAARLHFIHRHQIVLPTIADTKLGGLWPKARSPLYTLGPVGTVAVKLERGPLGSRRMYSMRVGPKNLDISKYHSKARHTLLYVRAGVIESEVHVIII